MSDPTAPCNCEQSQQLQARVDELEQAIEECWEALPVRHGRLEQQVAALAMRVAELEGTI